MKSCNGWARLVKLLEYHTDTGRTLPKHAVREAATIYPRPLQVDLLTLKVMSESV